MQLPFLISGVFLFFFGMYLQRDPWRIGDGSRLSEWLLSSIHPTSSEEAKNLKTLDATGGPLFRMIFSGWRAVLRFLGWILVIAGCAFVFVGAM